MQFFFEFYRKKYEIIKEIHQGIYDFASLYINTFQKDRFMFNVSGYDAYCPYRMLLRDISYFKRNFGKLIYARGISGDYKSQRLVHLEDVLKASNV